MSFYPPKLGYAGSMMTESPLKDLAALIRSRTPLIAIESNEEPQVVSLIRQIGRQLQVKAFRWTVTEGMQSFDPCDQPQQSVLKSQEVLRYIRSCSHSVFVLLDFRHYLEDSVHVRFLKDIALAYPQHYSTVILVGTVLSVPEELKPFTAHFRLPLPTLDELRGLVIDTAAEWGAQHGRREVQTTNKALDLLIRNLAGLTLSDARRLALKAISDDGAITESDIPEVMRAKYELLGRDSPLAFEYETARFAEVGGMQRLRNWLEIRKGFFLGATPEQIDPPRGILLLGVQGCGKSLAAKAAAGVFGVPLLRLDFTGLYSKYYGETERNLRKAFEVAAIMAPCVLWLDEIEKGIAGGEDDDGLSRRVLGILLTWMSEKKKPVFIVATANDIQRLPPEIVRKGRFDEIFFVDLPSPDSRRDILSIHLQKRSLDPARFDLGELVSVTEGFSGSEIEQAIVSAMYTAFAHERELAHQDILREVRQTRPLSVLMAEKVDELRQWAAQRTVPSD
ncbi:MAG TPA: AAA family ATPase [Clostridia bacterium]|nr:AAA family ATPase [Clostridia bacterium]